MIKIGIDQSLRFTGITAVLPGGKIDFYGVTCKPHTKWNKFANKPDNISIVDYAIEEKSEDNIENERIKYRNIRALLDQIDNILYNYSSTNEPVEVRMEGISFGSRQTTAIAELAALNFMIRDICNKYNITFTILPPTTVKKFATGNGQADKDLMTASFLACNPQLQATSKVLKIDDIADSYFMAMYES